MKNEDRLTKDDVENILKIGSKDDILYALLYLTFNIEDFEWIQQKCIEMGNDKNVEISGLALTCLGHIARIYGKINKETIKFLKSKLNSTDIGGRAQDALSDIKIFTSAKTS
jgi:hypothetical protein